MGIVFKQSSITSITSYLGVIIGYVNVLWIFPAVLSAEEIGLMRLLPSIAFILVPFTQLGLSQSILKFFPQYQDKDGGKNELVSFILFFNFVGFGLTLLLLKLFQSEVYEFFESKSALANSYLHVAVLLVLIISYQLIFESIAKSILRIIYPGFVRDIVVRLFYTTIVGLFFLGVITFGELINSLVVLYTLTTLLLISYVVKRSAIRLTLRFKHLGSKQAKEIFGYSVFSLIGASGNYILLNIDQLMISNLVGLEGNGIYTTAFFIAIVIEMPRRAMSSITTPLVSQFFQKNELSEVNKLYQKVSINQMLIGLLLLNGILVNLDTIFYMIPNNEVYQTGINVVLIIGIAKIIDMTFSINGEIILMSKYYRYNVLFTLILSLLAIGANWILIQAYGIDGAALATGITIVVYNLIKLSFLKLKLDLWPFTWANLQVLVIGTMTYALVSLIPQIYNSWVDLIARSIITSMIFLFPCLYLRVSDDVNNVVGQFVNKLFGSNLMEK